jgi:hypothetical protein
MKPNISEFSYGYALTECLIEFLRSQPLSLTAAPLFPSLYDEGRPGGGYDLRLDLPGIVLFLQFKLSDYIWKKYKNRIEEFRLDLFNTPFYRMHLRPARHSQQHQMLLDLEGQGPAGQRHEVYYAAPLFHEPYDLNQAYLTRQVPQRSIFIRPSNIGNLPDDENHHISYNNFNSGYFFSEPQQIEMDNLESMAHQVYSNIMTQERITLKETLHEISNEMVMIIKHRFPYPHWFKYDVDELHEKLDPFKQVAFLARTYFDCDILAVRRTG